MIENRNILDSFTLDFCNTVEKYCKYVIVSGFFAIVTGRSRGTEDIDILVETIDFEKFKKLHLDLLQEFELLSPIENTEELYEDYISKYIPIRYIRKNELFPNMEFKMCKNSVEKKAILNRKKYPQIELNIFLPEVEQQIAFKEIVLKSQKDIEDSNHLRLFFKEDIDKDLIQNYKNEFKEVYGL